MSEKTFHQPDEGGNDNDTVASNVQISCVVSVEGRYHRTDGRGHVVGETEEPLELYYAADFMRSHVRQAFYDALYQIDESIPNSLIPLIDKLNKEGPVGAGVAGIPGGALIEEWVTAYRLESIPNIQLDVLESLMRTLGDPESFQLRTWRTEAEASGCATEAANESLHQPSNETVDIAGSFRARFDVRDSTSDQAQKQIVDEVRRHVARELARIEAEAKELGALPDKSRVMRRDMVRLALRHFFGIKAAFILDYEDGFDVRLGDGTTLQSPHQREDSSQTLSQCSGVEKSIERAAKALGLNVTPRQRGRPVGTLKADTAVW